MKRPYSPIFIALFLIGAFSAARAQTTEDSAISTPITEDTSRPQYFVGVSAGGALAFGDDSYNVISDFKNANGISLSAYAGKHFSRIFSARLTARYQHLYSRVNLETKSLEDLFPEQYQGFFPRDGFYGYDCAGVQADAMFNLTNLLPNRTSDVFNLYLLGGLGFNAAYNYDKRVNWWKWESGYLESGWYEVDTHTHIMPSVMIGGILDFKLSKVVHLNLQLDCTFTGDTLEGVKSEEFYDAYITYTMGLAFHF